MRRLSAAMICTPLLLAGIAACMPVRGSTAQHSWNRASAARYLAARTQAWLHWGGSARGGGTACISCHTGLPLAMSLASLYNAPHHTEAVHAENLLVGNVVRRVESWHAICAQGAQPGNAAQCFYADKQPSSLGTESVMNALVLTNYDRARKAGLSLPAREALSYLWQQQQPNGSWLWLEFGLSPWEHDGGYYGSALAALAVGMAGRAYYTNPAISPHLHLLRTYLAQGFLQARLHDETVCLLASTWLPGILSNNTKKALIQSLLHLQHADGGWSLASLGSAGGQASIWSSPGAFPSGSASDGYATGLIVLTLKRAGMPAAAPAVRRGVTWLTTHEQNGTWPADYINGLRNPHSMTGRFMRDAASSYAILALQQK